MAYVALIPGDLVANKPARAGTFALRTYSNFEDHEARILALETDPLFLRASVTLTDAQVKALPTTAIDLIVAPGAGLILLPVLAMIDANASAGAYTNLNALGKLRLEYEGQQASSVVQNDNTLTVGSDLTALTDLLGTANRRIVTLVPPGAGIEENDRGIVSNVLWTSSNVLNKKIQIKADNNGGGNFTGGNAANTMKVVVFYTIEG
jgi:hypothetical protein